MTSPVDLLWRRILRKVWAYLGLYYALSIEYRAEIFLWILSMMMPLIMMGLWVEASSGADYGWAPMDFVRYFFAIFIVRQLTVVWVVWEFEHDVVEGKLSSKLLFPIDPIWSYMLLHVGERFVRLPLVLPPAALFFLLYPEAMWMPGGPDLLMAGAAVVLSFLLQFLIQYTLAMASFWAERAHTIVEMTFVMYLFLAGTVAPLDVYPQALRDVLMWTPFPYLFYFPGMLLMGESGVVMGGRAGGFAMAAGWCLVLYGLNRLVWRRGVRHYSAMGA